MINNPLVGDVPALQSGGTIVDELQWCTEVRKNILGGRSDCMHEAFVPTDLISVDPSAGELSVNAFSLHKIRLFT